MTDQRARLRELEQRVKDFNALRLPGQPLGVHMGTYSLVNDLLRALLDAEPEEPEGDRLQRIVNEQAEDDGLWFVAETAPEAYLQEQLRRLHAAIEARDDAAMEADDE